MLLYIKHLFFFKLYLSIYVLSILCCNAIYVHEHIRNKYCYKWIFNKCTSICAFVWVRLCVCVCVYTVCRAFLLLLSLISFIDNGCVFVWPCIKPEYVLYTRNTINSLPFYNTIRLKFNAIYKMYGMFTIIHHQHCYYKSSYYTTKTLFQTIKRIK